MNNEHPFRIVVVGHVDHGKSTVVGRILGETGALPEGKVEMIRQVCTKRGMPFEWAFVMDALQTERDQGITIDTTQIQFRTAQRPYLLIDAPGHKEFLKNMITGAASAEAAVLVIDAHQGVQEQTRRHGYLLHLLGLSQIAIAVNKMDLINWDEEQFAQVKQDIIDYLASINVTPTHVIPIAARSGDNILNPSPLSPWYQGPALLTALDQFSAAPQNFAQPLRFPIQDVYKFDDRRIIAGRIESGSCKVGDSLIFSPTQKTARIKSIESWSHNKHTQSPQAFAGQSIGLTLDEPIFVERGQIAHSSDHPPLIAHELQARIFWLGNIPFKLGQKLKLKLATAEYFVALTHIHNVVDVEDLSLAHPEQINKNAVAEITLRSKAPVVFDQFNDLQPLGRFVLVDEYDIVGGGVITEAVKYQDSSKSTNIFYVDHKVDRGARALSNGHTGGILWLTGLSGAGKTTIAIELERRLFLKGWHVTVLDGDNIRHGLCRDLDFSPAGRAENIRRIGEVAKLFSEAGMLVITSFISPYRQDRDNVRAISPENFHEIYVSTPLDVCEKRDPKGLYKRARRGEITNFTGVDSPYEAPIAPEFLLDTVAYSVPENVELLQNYAIKAFANPARDIYSI